MASGLFRRNLARPLQRPPFPVLRTARRIDQAHLQRLRPHCTGGRDTRSPAPLFLAHDPGEVTRANPPSKLPSGARLVRKRRCPRRSSGRTRRGARGRRQWRSRHERNHDLGHRTDELCRSKHIEARHAGLVDIACRAPHALVARRSKRRTCRRCAGRRPSVRTTPMPCLRGIRKRVVHFGHRSGSEGIAFCRTVDGDLRNAIRLVVKNVLVRLGRAPFEAHAEHGAFFRAIVDSRGVSSESPVRDPPSSGQTGYHKINQPVRPTRPNASAARRPAETAWPAIRYH